MLVFHLSLLFRALLIVVRCLYLEECLWLLMEGSRLTFIKIGGVLYIKFVVKCNL